MAPDQSWMSAGRFQEFDQREHDFMLETEQNQSRPTQVWSRHTGAPNAGMVQLQFSDMPIMSTHPGRLPSNPREQPYQLRQDCQRKLLQNSLSMVIDEPDVFGPLVNNLYDKLNSYSLKTCGPCEVLLYLSSHGLDSGNICLVPSAMKPHSTRSEHDLREIDPDKWYKYDNHHLEEKEL